jgi:hypothetical protein
MKIKNINSLFLAATLCGALTYTYQAHAKAGATDPIPGTSKSGLSTGGSGGGGGGGKTTTPVPAPTPAPAPQPIITAPLTFSSSGAITGNCNGSYRIDPYYPTLSLMTVTVSVDSLNLADSSVLYVEAVTTGGTVYPFTNNGIFVTAGAGIVSYSLYVTPGTTLSGVVVHDGAGVIDFAGN